MKLHVKLIICYVAAVIAVFFVINLLGNHYLHKSVYEDIRNTYYKHVQRIASVYSDLYYDREISLAQVRQQMVIYDELIDARIWVINANKYVLIDTRGSGAFQLDNYSEDLLNQVFAENVDFPGLFEEPMLCVNEAVVENYSVKGYICILVPMSRVVRDSTVYMNVANEMLLIIAGILLAVFYMIYLICVRPIRKVKKAAMEYANGNYEYPLKIRRRDEFTELAGTIAYMVDRVKGVEDYQKKFIANISHDFRSPLTSIKGYVEAIQDGTIPPESQDRYLDIIVFETDRLQKLTSNLLDLNRIDGKGLILDITSFDINTVIKKVAAAFEGTCKEKHIMLELEFAAIATYVDADMSRIQQVLYNLTDNAIKFSNQDSKVEIETEEKGSKVFVRIRDHGVGIAKENIGKIWDRFYKIDSSRGKDKKGTGLGLSIVKEVISAHDENISVISTEGVGTEFTFSLTQSEV
ncbi:MAG: HAMP domain-containing histidine kinase [Lachnospiraceae bacterium]|nr:HAMP domain-containing histidine kinase [Lachnospiraceae bacterium]